MSELMSGKEIKGAMADIRGMRQAAQAAGDLSDQLRAIQKKGYSADFYEIEEAVDEYIGGLSSAGVVLLLAYMTLKAKEPQA